MQHLVSTVVLTVGWVHLIMRGDTNFLPFVCDSPHLYMTAGYL